MELILNDLSLYGQFASIDDFEDYFIEYLNKPVNLIISQKIPLLKRQDSYSRQITKDITMYTYFKKSSNRTVATIIKKQIVDMAIGEPSWDVEGMMRTKSCIEYQYPDKQSEPNCYTEAIERKCPLLSVQKDNKAVEKIQCYRDKEPVETANITDLNTFLDAYIKDNIRNIRFVVEHYQMDKMIRCAEVSGKCYTESALLENDLNEQDIQKFLDNIPTLINDKSSGRSSHWWKSIKDDICEYRLSVSSGRELRVLFQWGEKLIFLNGFIKKAEKTPPGEIKLAERIIKQWTQ